MVDSSSYVKLVAEMTELKAIGVVTFVDFVVVVVGDGGVAVVEIVVVFVVALVVVVVVVAAAVVAAVVVNFVVVEDCAVVVGLVVVVNSADVVVVAVDVVSFAVGDVFASGHFVVDASQQTERKDGVAFEKVQDEIVVLGAEEVALVVSWIDVTVDSVDAEGNLGN